MNELKQRSGLTQEEERELKQLELYEQKLLKIYDSSRCKNNDGGHYMFRAYHCTKREESNDTEVSGLWLTVIVYLAFFFAVPLSLTITNPCLSYSDDLYYPTITLYSIAVLVVMIHACLFDRDARFCSKQMLIFHVLQVCNTLASLGAAVMFLNLFAYDLEAWYALFFIVFYMLSIPFFMASFWHQHDKNCALGQDKHVDLLQTKPICCSCITYETIFTILLIIFSACVITLAMISAINANDLHEDPERNALGSSCVIESTPSPTT